MRTIKFRGKDIETGEWIYGHFFFKDWDIILQSLSQDLVMEKLCTAK